MPIILNRYHPHPHGRRSSWVRAHPSAVGLRHSLSRWRKSSRKSPSARPSSWPAPNRQPHSARRVQPQASSQVDVVVTSILVVPHRPNPRRVPSHSPVRLLAGRSHPGRARRQNNTVRILPHINSNNNRDSISSSSVNSNRSESTPPTRTPHERLKSARPVQPMEERRSEGHRSSARGTWHSRDWTS